MSYRDSGYSVRDLGCEPDEYFDVKPTRDVCTCTYGAYVKYAGGTGFDIAQSDPACPEHGDGDDPEPPDPADRYDDDSTGTFADYDPRIDYPERYTDGPI